MRTHALLLAAWAALILADGARAQCSEGTTLGYGCNTLTAEGCCSGDVLYWCEGVWACRLSCATDPSCGWDAGASRYYCSTDGDSAPHNDPPRDCLDHDGDGWNPFQGDCDDNDANIHPTAEERCDGVDNDCDDNIDEGFDFDLDGYMGDPSCPPPLDCDDYHDTVYPGAPEEPYDGLDQDCDGEDLDDVDGDGYAGGSDGDDCNDEDPAVHPDKLEVCDDGKDNDCDGQADGADSECGGGDDDDDDIGPADDDVADDDVDPADDDVWIPAGPEEYEPFGFGCKCRIQGRQGTAALAAVLALTLGLLWVRRGRP